MKAILFDLDGTLIDSSEGITKSAKYALEHYGIHEENMDTLRKFIGPPLVRSFKELYGFSQEQSREAVEIYRERYKVKGIYECSLYDGVESTIKELKKRGYKIGLASSKPEKSCEIILKHFGIYDLFDEVVGATFDGKIDTKEEVLNELLRRWKDTDKDDICLIGDTIYDVEGANKVGIETIVVSYGFGNVEKMLEEGAKCSCDSMMELLTLFKGEENE